jgi:hypothetical protein
MDVVLDSNILIADPWLRSQRIRVLVDYLRKTRSSLVLLEAVAQEVRAHMVRLFSSAAGEIDSALRAAERKDLLSLPSFDVQKTIDVTTEAWEENFRRILNPLITKRVDLDSSLLPEVLRRAVNRIPPVSATGREIRDAIIWLSLLSYIRTRNGPAEIAFISSNTDDFAGPDKRTLRQELQKELVGVLGGLEYHPSIDSFIREHAEPISYISTEWVETHVDMNQAELLIHAYLERVSPAPYFKPSSWDFRDFYEPNITEVVYDPSVELEDVYVWQIDSEKIEVFLDFTVTVEAEIECILIGRGPWLRSSLGSYDRDEEDRPYRSLTCDAELKVSMAAIIKDQQLILGEIEEVDRL